MFHIKTRQNDDPHADLLFLAMNADQFYTDKHGTPYYTCHCCNRIFAVKSVQLPVATDEPTSNVPIWNCRRRRALRGAE